MAAARKTRDVTAEPSFLTRALKARPCGRPWTGSPSGPGQVLDPRGVPGRLPATGGRGPRVPRR
jgi:hypothetical protein